MYEEFSVSMVNRLDDVIEGRIRDREKITILFRMLYDLLYIYVGVDWSEREVLDMIVTRVEHSDYPNDTMRGTALDVMIDIVADVYDTLTQRW